MKVKAKKIPSYLLLLLLTGGASLILGLLSFGGMFVLFPSLTLAGIALTLSVAYEGEILETNIFGAFKKLYLKTDYLKHYLANEFLLENFPNTQEKCPQFFKDYEAQLKLLHKFDHKRLNKEDAAKKKLIEKTLRDMEKWFAIQLFLSANALHELSDYEIELRDWLADHGQADKIKQLEERRNTYSYVKMFSLLAGFFMGYGTTYLLVEAFEVIPFLAAIPAASLPMLIIPMALVAGAAYGLLTFNAVTDMINNDTLRSWYNRVTNKVEKEGYTLRNLFLASTSIFLVTLTLALTACTAGTWWTVMRNTRPLFPWMEKFSRYVMGPLTLTMSSSTLSFNFQNTSDTMEMIEELTEPAKKKKAEKPQISTWQKIKQFYTELRQRENLLQIINLPRLFLAITLTPLRVLLFLGHLISIGVTADRMPGIPEIASAILGIISEGFEDVHYFVGHEHKHDHSTKGLLEERLKSGHGHDHNADLPTRLLKLIFLPAYTLATLWDSAASQFNKGDQRLTLGKAWDKQTGQPPEKPVKLNDMERPSENWREHQVHYRIDRFKEKHLSHVVLGKALAKQKTDSLTKFQEKLHVAKDGQKTVVELLQDEAENATYKIHRTHGIFGLFSNEETSTHELLAKELPARIATLA